MSLQDYKDLLEQARSVMDGESEAAPSAEDNITVNTQIPEPEQPASEPSSAAKLPQEACDHALTNKIEKEFENNEPPSRYFNTPKLIKPLEKENKEELKECSIQILPQAEKTRKAAEAEAEKVFEPEEKTRVISKAEQSEITPSAVGLQDSPTKILPEPFESPGGWLIPPQNTGGVPKLVTPGAHDPVSEINDKPEYDLEQDEAQIRIEGFDVKEPPVPQVDDEIAEINLKNRRENLVSSFQVDIPPREEEDEKAEENQTKRSEAQAGENQDFEYRKPSEQRDFNRVLLYNARKYSSRSFWTALLMIFGALLAAVSFGAESNVGGVENTVFSMGANIICLCLLGWLCLREIPGGIQLLISGKGNSDSAFAITYILAFTLSLLPLFTDSMRVGGAVVFSMPVLIAGFWNTAAKNAILQNLQRNFNEWAIRRGDSIYSVHAVDDNADVQDMSTGLRIPDSPILVSQKALFPSSFRRMGEDSANVDRLFKLLIPIAGVFAVGVSVGVYLSTKNYALSLALLPAAFSSLLPISLLAAQTLPLRKLRRQLEADGAMLASVTAAQELAKAKTFALDGVELYQRQECQMTDFRCVRKDVRQFDIMLYAAAMLREMDGPAMDACRRQMLFDDAEIPVLRDVRVERYGISAKIPQGHLTHTVLLGTLKFLNLREVKDVPESTDEMRWTRHGFKPLYLAVGGQFQAYMLFSYKPAQHLEKLREIVSGGMQLLVATRDPNINEHELARQLKLTQNTVKQQNAVKVANTRGEEAFQKYRLQESASADAAALHDGSAYSYIALINAALKLTKAARITTIFQLLLLAGAALFFSVSLLLGLDAVIAVIALCGIQLLGTVLLLFLGRL